MAFELADRRAVTGAHLVDVDLELRAHVGLGFGPGEQGLQRLKWSSAYSSEPTTAAMAAPVAPVAPLAAPVLQATPPT